MVLLIPFVAATVAPAQNRDRKPSEVVSFDREVRPILRKRSPTVTTERPRGELDLTSYAGLVTGGAGGKAAVPNSPDESPLYTFAAHLEEPHMPPNAAKIPQRELDILPMGRGGPDRNPGRSPPGWLTGARRRGRFSSPPGGFVSPRPCPTRRRLPPLQSARPRRSWRSPASSRSSSSTSPAGKLRGALAFPEGDVFALKFSRDGRSLLAAGGVGASWARRLSSRPRPGPERRHWATSSTRSSPPT